MALNNPGSVALLIVCAVMTTCVCGCRKSPEQAVMGEWKGGFEDSSTKREQLTGYLDLAGDPRAIRQPRSFSLSLTTGMQDFEVFGNWRITGEELRLDVNRFMTNDSDKSQIRLRDYPYFDAERVRSSLGPTIMLEKSGLTRWVGLPITIDSAKGRLIFDFDPPAHR